MSKNEKTEFLMKVLDKWNRFCMYYESLNDKSFESMKDHFIHKDKGEYIIISDEYLRIFIYNEEGMAKLSELFGIEKENIKKFHLSKESIEEQIY